MGLEDALYRRSLLAPAAVGISLGTQWTVVLMIALGPLAERPAMDSLTVVGTVAIHPEYDLPVFVLGCALTLIAIASHLFLWNRHLRRVPAKDAPRFLSFGYALQLLTAFVSGLAFIASCEIVRRSAFDRWQPSLGELSVLLAPSAFAIAMIAIHYVSANAAYEKALLPRVLAALSCGSPWRRRLIDLGAACGIVALVYVPSAATLTGAVYMYDKFFHWDHFAAGAAWAYANGMALGTEVYCQYGVGYPFLAGLAWGVVPPSYTGFIYAAVLYACVYFITYYAVLRVSSVHPLIAVAGTLTAIWASLFGPFRSEPNIQWAWPSQSILRAPLDVWMALALIAHLRSGRRIWLATAGLLGGAAVFFEIDTGVPLLIALGVYCLATAFVDRPANGPTVFGDLAATGCAFLLVLTAGLAAASRGTLATSPIEFFTGWMKGITGYAANGAGNMYFLSRTNPAQLTIFFALVAICFVPVALALTRLLHGQASRAHIFGAACGIYGLERLTVYVSRSLDNNLLHASLPAIGILTLVAAYFHSTVLRSNDRSERILPLNIERNALRIAYPATAVLVAALLLWTSDTFHHYPSLLRSTVKGLPDPGLPILEDTFEARGIPVENAGALDDIESGVEKLRELRARNATAVVLDEQATFYNIAAGIPPWRADFSVYFNTFFVQDRENVLSELLSYAPDYVLIATESPNEWYNDTWAFYRDGVAKNYVQVERVGAFDLLERRK